MEYGIFVDNSDGIDISRNKISGVARAIHVRRSRNANVAENEINAIDVGPLLEALAVGLQGANQPNAATAAVQLIGAVNGETADTSKIARLWANVKTGVAGAAMAGELVALAERIEPLLHLH